MAENFCKLYETKEMGQVLVKQDIDAECNPEVRVHVIAPEMGVCSMAMSFTDDDEGWERADACFEAIDEAKAREIAIAIVRGACQVGDGCSEVKNQANYR